MIPILFSAGFSIRKEPISDLLLNSSDTFDFIAPIAIIGELEKHNERLLRISGYSQNELDFLKRIVLKKIEFINLESVSSRSWEKAIELTSIVDQFDAPFIALSLELDAPLWTGDKKLTKAVVKKGINWIPDTLSIKKLRETE